MKHLLLAFLSMALATLSSQAYARAEPLENFIRLFDSYCIVPGNTAATVNHLHNSGYEKSANSDSQYYDSYTILLNNIDYAITPERSVGDQPEGCTTGVRLKQPKTGLLFTNEELINLISQRYNLTEINSRTFQYTSLSNIDTFIQLSHFTDSSGRRYQLLYPKTNQGEYYMALTITWPE